MLSLLDNELLTAIGPKTPMGQLWRAYWVPVLRGPVLEAGGDPKRVRVFGENFAAFRNRDGKVAIIDEACPHRGASMVLGRNEDCGLRCLYHGWVISVEGLVTETPNDPTLSRPDKIPVRHVPVREAGEMIWGWFGEGTPPPFPDFVFNRCEAPSEVRTTVGIVKANWLQVIENVFDPLHTNLLHGPGNKDNWDDCGHPAADAGSPFYESANTPPKQPLPPTNLEVEFTDYGFRTRMSHAYANIGEGKWFPMVMPGWQFVPAPDGCEDGDITIFGHTPVDDQNTMLWVVAWNPVKQLGPMENFHPDTCEDPNNFVPENYDISTQWLQDRQAMDERRSYSGLGIGKKATAVFLEDVAMTESMGAIVDRSKEHLCKADKAVAMGRRMYLNAVRAHMKDGVAHGADYDVSRISLPDGPENLPPKKVKPEAIDI